MYDNLPLVCCKHCDPCPNCYNINEYYIADLLYAINLKISENYDRYLKLMSYGYGCVFPDNDNKKLTIFKDSLQKFYTAITNGYAVCLCPNEIQLIIEEVLDLINIGCCTSSERCDIEIDDTNREMWILDNPYCVSYDSWEILARKICPKFEISSLYLPDAGKLLYTLKSYELIRERADLSSELISFGNDVRYFRSLDCWDVTATVDGCEFDYKVTSKEIEDCILKYNISAATVEKCLTLGIDVRELDTCLFNYNLLVKETKCDISFDTYVKLLSCNFSYDILSTLVKCGVQVNFSADEELPKLTIGGRVIQPSDIAHLPSCNLDQLIII